MSFEIELKVNDEPTSLQRKQPYIGFTYPYLKNIVIESPKNKRGCYCGTLSKEFLSEHGIPDGYCGTCSVCGQPGHLRHAPGCHPYTDAWCDKCFRPAWVRNNSQCVLLLAIPVSLLLGYWYASALGAIVLAVLLYTGKRKK